LRLKFECAPKILHLFVLIRAVLRKQKPNSLCTVTRGSVPLPAAPMAAQATGISPPVADTSSRWNATVQALEKSVEPRRGGDGLEWFFLAAAQGKLGEKGKATECFRRGVRWMEENKPGDKDFRRLSATSEQVLGQSDEQ
jgi:hypothetical protein